MLAADDTSRLPALLVGLVLLLVGGAVWLLVLPGGQEGPAGSGRLERLDLPPRSTSPRDVAGSPAPVRTIPRVPVTLPAGLLEAPTELGPLLVGPRATQITGRVTSQDGRPVPGARVEVFENTSRLVGRPHVGWSLGRVATASDGGFHLEAGLAAGTTYLLRVTHGEHPRAWLLDLDPLIPSSLSRDVRLPPAWPLEGSVRLAGSQGVAGAEVTLLDLDAPAGPPEVAVERRVETGADGSFTCVAVSPGRKRLLVQAPGLTTTAREGLVVSAVRPTPPQRFILEPGRVLSGRVLDAVSGAELPGALVIARPLKRSGGRPGTGVQVETRSNAAGVFSFEGLRAGLHVLQAEARGYARSPARNVSPPGEDVILKLRPGGRVKGRILDASGQSLGGVAVVASRTPDFSGAPWAGQSRSESADGAFRLDRVPEGRFWILARAPGYGAGRLGPFELAAGEHLSGLALEVEKGATVSGRVLDEQGRPLRGVKVTLLRKIDLPRRRNADKHAVKQVRKLLLSPVGEVTTWPDGSFVAVAMAPGTHAVRVQGNQRHATARSELFDLSVGGEHRVADIGLVLAAGISGVVLDRRGRPDPQASVSLLSMDDTSVRSTAATDSGGRFRILGLPPGMFDVIVTRRAGRVDVEAVSGRARASRRRVSLVGGSIAEVELKDG